MELANAALTTGLLGIFLPFHQDQAIDFARLLYVLYGKKLVDVFYQIFRRFVQTLSKTRRSIQRSPFSKVWIILLTKTSVELLGKAG